MPTARVQEADCSRFVPRLALVFPLRAFFGLYSSCSFLFISIYYLLSSSSCRIFIYFGSSFLFSFFFSSLLGSRSARLCALFCVRRPFGLLFLLDSSRIPPQHIGPRKRRPPKSIKMANVTKNKYKNSERNFA